MVDEDYFDDFNRRRPRTQVYRGSYRNPGSSQFFDPSGAILAGIESVEKTIGERKTAVRDFENAAAVRRQETLDSLRETEGTEGMSDTTAIDSLQQQLMKEVDELYKLDIASFEGDRSAYLKKAGEVNKIVETIPALMGLIDAEGEALKENQSSSQDFFKKLLRSNDPNYYDFVDAASKGGPGVSFRTQNGNIIAQLNGKDIFNGNAYVKAKKDGFDLVKYAGDYTPQINEADALASKGLDSLVTTETTEKVNKGIELVGEEKTNYTLAKQKYEERLRSGNIPIPVNESTYQMFTNYGVSDSDKKDPWGKDLQMQEGATREAVIQFMIDRKFPGGDKVTTKTTTKEIQGQKMSELDRQKLALERAKLNQEIKEFEEEQKGPDISKTPTGYVDRQNTALSTAINSNNKEAVKNIINTEISSASGVDPKSITFDGDKLTIITGKSTGEKAYTAEQAKLINDAAGTIIIGRNGTIIDEDGFKTLNESNPIEEPEGKPIEKPGQTIVIDNYKSANGEAQLLNILARNRFSTAKDISESLTHIEGLTGVKLQEEVSGQRSAEQLKIQKANLKALKSDASKQSNNEQLVSFNNPGSEFSKNAINFFKSLPSDFIVDTYDYGKITVKEYLSKPSIKLGDLYNHYASAYEEVIKNASKYPDTVLSYTSLENIKQDNKKTAYTKKS
jgi:hypothetical protein